MGRRWLAECKMPNPADQAALTSKLTIEIQSMTIKTYAGEIGAAVPTAGPAGSTAPMGVGGASLLDQTTLPYSVKSHTGCVHITVLGQADRVTVSVIVQEH